VRASAPRDGIPHRIVLSTYLLTVLKEGVHPVWLKEVKWERYKTAKDTASRSDATEGEEDDERGMRQHRVGSIIDLLDEFEAHAWPSYPYHRYTLERTRASKGEA